MKPCALKFIAAALVAMPVAGLAAPGMSPALAQPPVWEPEGPQVKNQQEWLAHLQGQLNRMKRLPPELIGVLKPGPYKVVLGFEVDPVGQVSGVAIRESSGQPALDEAAQKTVLSIAPLPAFTADMKQQAQQFRLPMVFVVPELEKPDAQAGTGAPSPRQ